MGTQVVLKNRHLCGHGMVSISTWSCGKVWVCLVGGAGKDGRGVNSLCEARELVS